MFEISHENYRTAFNLYLRKGIAPETSLEIMHKMAQAETAQNHTTNLYIWRTRKDGKVRASHAANDGEVFAWNNPPPTGHPGEDFGCRCVAEPYREPRNPLYDPPIEPVYPELLFIPLLRVTRLITAWRLWAREEESLRPWQFGKHKSEIKWANRLRKGNWTPEEINNTIRNGVAHRAPNNINKLNSATRYQLGDKYVVVDDVTNELLQVSGPGYEPNILP
jgi:SPP1 gp7 family putative phage head morphogenesis protein